MAPLMYPERPNGKTVVLTTSQRVAPSASAASIWLCGVWMKTSRVTAVMIGRIITASTIPAVKTVPPPDTDALPVAKTNTQPRWSLSQVAIGRNRGPST